MASLQEDSVRDIDEIADIIGMEKARMLADRLGGVSQYVSMKVPEPRIVDAVGLEAAEAIREYFGGATVYISRALSADAAAAKRTRMEIVRLYHDGVDIADIACQTRRSVRQIYRVLRNVSAGPRKTPNRRVRELQRRNDEIRRKFVGGMPAEQIAAEIGRSKGSVTTVLRRMNLVASAPAETRRAPSRRQSSRH